MRLDPLDPTAKSGKMRNIIVSYHGFAANVMPLFLGLIAVTHQKKAFQCSYLHSFKDKEAQKSSWEKISIEQKAFFTTQRGIFTKENWLFLFQTILQLPTQLQFPLPEAKKGHLSSDFHK